MSAELAIIQFFNGALLLLAVVFLRRRFKQSDDLMAADGKNKEYDTTKQNQFQDQEVTIDTNTSTLSEESKDEMKVNTTSQNDHDQDTIDTTTSTLKEEGKDNPNIKKFEYFGIQNAASTMGADMKEEKKDPGDIICCSSCGVGDTNLKKCDACDLVQYCSDDCQKEHRPHHEEACKKRAAELRDLILFDQPETTHRGDCPICLLPIPLNIDTYVLQACCSKFICDGCFFANRERELADNLEQRCPFCRDKTPSTNKEADARNMARLKVGDSVALCEVGKKHYHDGDRKAAFEYWKKAVEAGGPGAPDAHNNLAMVYAHLDAGCSEITEKDEKLELYHLEEACIGGHPIARFRLANYESRHKEHDRAIRHLIIAAKQGSDEAIKNFRDLYAQGKVNMEGFAALLRLYQDAVEATKSPLREAAAKARAHGISPGQHMRSQQQQQMQEPVNRTRPVNGARGRGGKKKSGKGKGKQTKQLEKQKTKKTTTKQQPKKL
eukprot:scaffold7161_cov103-Skeletonema_dohrnii-CCMP3373.AAC.5